MLSFHIPAGLRPSRTLRAAAAASVLAVTAALITGCSSDSDETASAAPEGAFPATVEHAYGATTIDSEPTRIAVVGYTEQDTLLALGITPVAVTEWYGEQPYATWPWAQDELGDGTPEVLSVADGFEYEKIAAAEPDLIIGTNAGMTQEDYTQLSEIAPTIAHSGDFTMYFEPWDVQTLAIGKAVGREEDTQKLIDDVKAKFADAAAAHPEFDGATAVLLQNAIYDNSAIAYQDGLSTDFLTDLGFHIPSEIDAFAPPGDDSGQAYIPVENLNVLDAADVLLWATESPDDRTALEQTPLYSSLRAVKENQQVFTDAITAGAIYFTSVLSLPYVIDKLVPAFAATLAGDGVATTD